MVSFALATLASGQRGPRDLAADVSHVYWVNYSGGSVMTGPRTGGVPPTELVAGRQKPWRIALDDHYVYWVEEIARGAVMRVPKTGGPVVAVAQAASPASVETRRDNVYWVTTGGLVQSCPVHGQTVTTLASTTGKPWRMAIDDTAVYWTNGIGTIMTVPLDGGAAEVLASGQGDPRDIALDDGEVYWSTHGGAIRAVSKRGGDARTVAESPGETRGVAVSGGWVYWTVTRRGLLMRARTSGSSVEEVATGLKYPLNLVADKWSVFVTCFTGGSVVRVDL